MYHRATFVGLLMTWCVAAVGGTILVDPDGGGDFQDIQSALDAAEDFVDSDAELEVRKEAPRSAEEWLAQLLELQKSGQAEILEDEIAAFIEYYPDYPLPEELLAEKP